MRLGSKFPTAGSFAAAILVFLLPFVDVRCENTSLSKLTGLELATGYKLKTGDDNSLRGKLSSIDDDTKMKADNSVDYYIMAAFIFGILGLILSLAVKKKTIAFMLACLGLVALVAFFINVQSQLSDAVTDKTEKGYITVHFELGYYLEIAMFILAALFSLKRRVRSNSAGKLS